MFYIHLIFNEIHKKNQIDITKFLRKYKQNGIELFFNVDKIFFQ